MLPRHNVAMEGYQGDKVKRANRSPAPKHALARPTTTTKCAINISNRGVLTQQLLQFKEESSQITAMQLSTLNACVLLFSNAFAVLLRQRRRLTSSSTNALLSSKKRFLLIKLITL